LIEFNKNILSV